MRASKLVMAAFSSSGNTYTAAHPRRHSSRDGGDDDNDQFLPSLATHTHTLEDIYVEVVERTLNGLLLHVDERLVDGHRRTEVGYDHLHPHVLARPSQQVRTFTRQKN